MLPKRYPKQPAICSLLPYRKTNRPASDLSLAHRIRVQSSDLQCLPVVPSNPRPNKVRRLFNNKPISNQPFVGPSAGPARIPFFGTLTLLYKGALFHKLCAGNRSQVSGVSFRE